MRPAMFFYTSTTGILHRRGRSAQAPTRVALGKLAACICALLFWPHALSSPDVAATSAGRDFSCHVQAQGLGGARS